MARIRASTYSRNLHCQRCSATIPPRAHHYRVVALVVCPDCITLLETSEVDMDGDNVFMVTDLYTAEQIALMRRLAMSWHEHGDIDDHARHTLAIRITGRAIELGLEAP